MHASQGPAVRTPETAPPVTLRATPVLVTLGAFLALLPQFLDFAGRVQRGDYGGTASKPRVAAFLGASTATLEGGPFATVPVKGGYSVALDLFNDLGIAAAISAWTHATGRQATEATLGSLNLIVLVISFVLLVPAFPAQVRMALIPVFLLVELVDPRYRSMDSVSMHTSLAALAIALPLLTLRASRPWIAIFWGILCFALHKTRAVYGLFSLMALALSLAASFRLVRDRTLIVRAGFFLLGFLACEVPWRMAVERRMNDPRLVESDSLPAHGIYQPLLSGIGWTPNPWGLKPWDPWLAQFLGDTMRAAPVPVATQEGERRAKQMYITLAKQRPFALGWLYARRLPGALSEHSLFGAAGAVLWVVAASVALALAWRHRDADGLSLVLIPVTVACCLVLQTMVIDTRPIYAHPLGLVSALILAAGIPVALRNARHQWGARRAADS
jgi:hypothetical protein